MEAKYYSIVVIALLLYCITGLFVTKIFAQNLMNKDMNTCLVNWSDLVQITSDSANSFTLNQSVVSYDSMVFCIWKSGIADTSLYALSYDNGEHWTAPFRMYLPTVSHYRVVSYGTHIYIVFNHGGFPDPEMVYFSHSSNFGLSWDSTRILFPKRMLCFAHKDNMLFINFIDSTGTSRTAVSLNYGRTWNVKGPAPSFYDMIATSYGLCGVYTEVVNSAQEIVYRRSGNFGTSWENPETLSTIDNITGQLPSIAADSNNNIYVDWMDGKYGGTWGGTLLFRKGMNNGTIWLPEKRLTVEPICVFSDIAVYKNTIQIVWDSYEYPDSEYCYFSLSNDLGESWCMPQKFSTSMPVDGGGHPDITVGNYSHIVWWRNYSNPEIFYRRAEVGQTGIINNIEVNPSITVFPAFPNPFNSTINITFKINERKTISVKIYDVLGRVTKELANDEYFSGYFSVYWDGTDNSNTTVASGIYFVQVSSDNRRYYQSIILTH